MSVGIALHLHNIWISHCSMTSLTRGSTQSLDQEIPLGGLPKDECTRRPWTFPQLLVLGQLGRTDARQASAASRWKHHLTKWQCTESDGLTQKGTYFAIKGYLFCKKWSALGDPNTDSVEDDWCSTAMSEPAIHWCSWGRSISCHESGNVGTTFWKLAEMKVSILLGPGGAYPCHEV